jgi:Fur family transcriptional regulator, iron response regulator
MHRHATQAPDRTHATAPAAVELRDRIARDLESHGLKGTPQRILIASVLMKAPRHLTAEQILHELKTSGRRVSKATVYNTLKVLSEHGLIRQINLGGDHSVYDSTATPHHHFHNVDTGELVDIRPEEVDLQRLPPLPEGTEATSVEIVIRIRRRVD